MKKQQGDVILRDAVIPEGARRVPRTKRGYVLAEGEATGHAHVIENENVEMYEKDGVIYLKVDKPAVVKHEEHKAIRLEIGTYKIGHVREFDPWAEEDERIRQLGD